MNVKDVKIAGLTAIVTIVLFVSGFLVLLTPLPILFASVVSERNVRRLAAVMIVAVMSVMYLLAMPYLSGNMAGRWIADVIFILPGAALVEQFGVLSAQYFGFFYLIYFLLFGYLLGEGVRRKWKATRRFLIPVGLTFIFVIVAIFIPEAAGVGVINGAREYMTKIVTDIIRAQESAGISGERLFYLKNNIHNVVASAIRLLPSIIFLAGLLVAVVNCMVARAVIKAPRGISYFGDARNFALPEHMIWFPIGLGFLFFFNAYIAHSTVLWSITLNGLAAFGGIYFLQGAFIVASILGIVKSRFLKAVTYILLFMFIQISAPVIAIIGFADLWVDFRRIVGKKDNKKKRSLPWK